MLMRRKKEDEGSKLKRKSHDEEIDENIQISREADAREKAGFEAQYTLKTQRSVFPP